MSSAQLGQGQPSSDIVPFEPTGQQWQLCRERQTYFLLNNGTVAVVRNVTEQQLKGLFVAPLKRLAEASSLVLADLSLVDKELRLVFLDTGAAKSACETASKLLLDIQFPVFDLELVQAQPSDWHPTERLEVVRAPKHRHYFRSELDPTGSRFAPDLVLDTHEPHVELWTNICECAPYPAGGFFHRGMIGSLLPAALCNPPSFAVDPSNALLSATAAAPITHSAPMPAPGDQTPSASTSANGPRPLSAQQTQQQSYGVQNPAMERWDRGQGAGTGSEGPQGVKRRKGDEEIAEPMQGVEPSRSLPIKPSERARRIYLIRIRNLEPRWNEKGLFMNFFRDLMAKELNLNVRAFHGPDRCTNETYGFIVFHDLATASRALDHLNYKLQDASSWAEHWDSVGDRSQVAVHAGGRGFEWTLPQRMDFATEAFNRTGCKAFVGRCIGESMIFLYDSNEQACRVVQAMEGASRGLGHPTLRCSIYSNPEQVDFGILPQLSNQSSGWKDHASRAY